MKGLGLILLAAFFPTAAFAGPNAGGTLVAHDATLLVSATSSSTSICSQGTIPDSCGAIDTRLDGSSSSAPKIWKVYAAFPATSSPSLSGISWGIHFDPDLLSVDAGGNCADWELNDNGWPDSDLGSQVTWQTAQTSHLVPVYWFAGYQVSTTPAAFELRGHPSQEGKFGDNTVPAVLDPIAGYGRLGFGSAGFNPCAGADSLGGPGGPGESNDTDSAAWAGSPDSESSDAPPSLEEGATNTLVVWIDHDAIAADQSLQTPAQIQSVSSLKEGPRNALQSTGVLSLRPEFPGLSAADTLVSDHRGHSIRRGDLSGFYYLQYPSAEHAAAAIPALVATPGIRTAQVMRVAATQTDPNDPYFYQFPSDPPLCHNDAHCRLDAQWFLINTGQRPARGNCSVSTPGVDIAPPSTGWPLTGGLWGIHRAMIGEVDTGIQDDHSDLNVVPLAPEERAVIQTHPMCDWCSSHGTRSAGLVAAATNNAIGVAGVCNGCPILDIEAASCDTVDCIAHSEAQCDHIGPSSNQIRQSVNRFYDSGLRVINWEGAGEDFMGVDDVAVLYEAYYAGVVLVCPRQDISYHEPHQQYPSNLPCVLGVGGFTHDGAFWCDSTSCYFPNRSNGTTPGPGVDICGPACPMYVSTTAEVDTTIHYGWSSGQCSGASAIVAGAIGYLYSRLLNDCPYWNPEYDPEPDAEFFPAILQLTATPWEVNPMDYADCVLCSPSDFGPGRINLAAAQAVFDRLYCEGAAREYMHYVSRQWGEFQFAVTDSVDYQVFGSGEMFWVREYTVQAPVFIPPSGFDIFGPGYPNYIAYASPLHNTSTLLAYGYTNPAASAYPRYDLALRYRIPDCQMTPIDQATGQATLIGHNFARLVKDQSGTVTEIQYIVQPQHLSMGYCVVKVDPWYESGAREGASNDLPDRENLRVFPARDPGHFIIECALPRATAVAVEVMDVSGRQVAEILEGPQRAGIHRLTWAGDSGSGQRLPSGVYWVVMRAGNHQMSKRAVVVR
jgi:hypothetical protein